MTKQRSAHTMLCKAMEQILAMRVDCYGWANNTGGMKIGDRFLRFGKKGSSDWLGITLDGKLLALECKTGDGQQSPDQKHFQKIIEAYGGRYKVVRSVQDAITFLDSLKLERTKEHAIFLREVRRPRTEAIGRPKKPLRIVSEHD